MSANIVHFKAFVQAMGHADSVHGIFMLQGTSVQLEKASPKVTPLRNKSQRKEQLTDPPHFKGNWTTVNWLVWKDLYSKTGLPFCSWTVCKASWNSLQWASGLEKLELSQFLHQRWPPSGKPAAIFLFRTSPRQDGQQLFLCSDFGEHWELWQCDHCHYKKINTYEQLLGWYGAAAVLSAWHLSWWLLC